MVVGGVLGNLGENGAIPTIGIELPIYTVVGFSCCGGTSVRNGVSPFGSVVTGHNPYFSCRESTQHIAAKEKMRSSLARGESFLRLGDFGAALRGGNPSSFSRRVDVF